MEQWSRITFLAVPILKALFPESVSIFPCLIRKFLIIILLSPLADISLPITPIPGEGAVCPLIVVELEREMGDWRTMYPLTANVMLRPMVLTASRKVPVPESARLVTTNGVVPPVATEPKPTAPGNARDETR